MVRQTAAIPLWLALAAPAKAVTLQEGAAGYSGTDDTSIYQDYPDNSNGGFPLIFSGATVNSTRRALIRFNLSALPEISSPEVSLTLVLERSGLEAGNPDIYTLHRVTTPWGEGAAATEDINIGGIGVPANPGDATWTASRFEDTAWETAGGDYLPEPSASLAIGRWDSIVPENNVYTFSSLGLSQDVEFWLQNPEENHGWILIGVEDVARNARRFYSSEADAPALRPQLTIETNLLHAPAWSLYSD